ncbi:MAG: response regulator transcription factor [Bacteroidota bacterium]
MAIKILIVDDHHMFLEGISALLNDHDTIKIVSRAESGNDALTKLSEDSEVDVLISDLSMPDMDGFDLCEQIKKLYPDIKVLMLSMHSDSSSIKKAIRAGARGYILKNTGHDELIKAITTLYEGGTYYSDRVKDNLVADISGEEEKCIHEEVRLTKREEEVLKLIAMEYTSQMIAEELFISFHTVESHRKNLMKKLRTNNLGGLIKYAIKNGYAE